nr:uncharacterized protein LOC113818560 [Penaeus vannamei]
MGEFGRNIIILIFAAVCIWITNGEIGGKCTYSSGCPVPEVCTDNHCACSDIKYSESLYPQCDWVSFCLHNTTCWENAQCVDFACVCLKHYYKIESSCRRVSFVRVMSTCRANEHVVYLCDIRKHSVCINNTCVCAKGYIPTSEGSCEAQEVYMKKYSLSEYRVKPGEYCRESADCIEGLECQGFQCKCPTACRYDQRKEICDCGKAAIQVGPIYLGVFLGLLVLLFWYYTIERTIKNHKKMMSQFSSLSAADDGYVPTSYPLSPVHSSIQTETTADGTASPASRTAGTPIHEGTGTSQTYSINPRTAPNYPVNPESDKPPSYVDVISSPLYSRMAGVATPDPASQPLTFEDHIPEVPHLYHIIVVPQEHHILLVVP